MSERAPDPLRREPQVPPRRPDLDVVNRAAEAPPSLFAEPPLKDPNLIRRYSTGARLTHTAVAIAYVYLFLTGLALFHPAFYWLAAFSGGGELMRILHPWVGVGLGVFFLGYALTLWRDNLLKKNDGAWLGTMFRYMRKEHEGIPEQGKYNAGQKVLFWSMLLFVTALLLSGLVVWQPYFAPSFTAQMRMLASVVHAITAFLMFIGIGIHIYAAIWTKGSIKAITQGTVTRAWARYHHPAWAREVEERGRQR